MKRLLRPLVAACAFALVSLSIAGAAAGPYDPFFAGQATVADFGAGTRPFGNAAADFDKDGKVDLVVGRALGQVSFLKGNGDATFAPATTYAWKQAALNVWALGAGDFNGDGNADVAWGATAASSGCTAPVPTGQTCAGVGGTAVTLNDGDLRIFWGNGDGTFQQSPYYVTTVLHNMGTLVADLGTDTSSLTVGDVDGDNDLDIVAGTIDGTNATVKLLRNNGAGTFGAPELVISQTQGTTVGSPTYFPPTSTAMASSPWGLSLADIDNDGDRDLWVGDRALYVYYYRNDGTGAFALQGGNDAVAGRPNAYLGHDSSRAAVGFTESLASGDVNGDGKADLVLGLQSGTQTPASGTAHDGELLLDVSTLSGHSGVGSVADIGTEARGVNVVDLNGDAELDIVAGEYDGKIKVLRQLPPVDSDADGVSDYVDNAPNVANPARLDMNTDASVNFRDQLDNDFDTVLGDPENPATWQRLGDIVDPDDDNDGVVDGADNCPFASNAFQANADADALGDACDPLDNRDGDADGVLTGPLAGDQYYAEAQAAAIKWGQGTTHFVIRIDALGRFFQNEFTQILTDAATLSPGDWAAKCWENYDPGDIPTDPAYEPCGDDATKALSLDGGKGVPVTLVTIPKQLWTDPPVVAWINDRDDNANLEVGQHGTYHVNNIPVSDWKDLGDRNFFSCEPCGLSEAENLELMQVGRATLLGDYANKWVAEAGATAGSPKIDWGSSAHPLLSYAPPFNTSDTVGREAIAQLGFRSFSASVFEESGSYSPIFTPEGSHHEQFDQFGMFHASADAEVDPPDTTGDTYNQAAWQAELEANTQAGGLNTWLIEEVEWSGRPCNNSDRLGTCNGGSNRENDTVYLPRWQAWLQLLDFVKNYPGGVAMTMGEVALAEAYDNAPTVVNPGQADSDHDGVGDAIDGASLTLPASTIVNRNESAALTATLLNGSSQPIVGQEVTFSFDADGDATAETYTDTTNGSGVAEVTVTATRPVGPAAYSASWDGLRATAAANGSLSVADATQLDLDAGNPASGQVSDQVTVGATLTDSDDAALAGKSVAFTIGGATASGTTDASGHAAATLTLVGPAAVGTVAASFAGDGPYGTSSATAAFQVLKEDTTATLADAVATKQTRAIAVATLKEADGAPLAARTITFAVEQTVKGQKVFVAFGTATTDASGIARLEVPAKYVATVKKPIKATFGGDASYLASSATAFAYRK